MRLIALLLMLAAAVAGWIWQTPPYHLQAKGLPADQSPLAHRDSAYSSSTWVASTGENFLQLRFFDRIEGGVCLHPTWSELRELAEQEPGLRHLVPAAGEVPRPAPAGKIWGGGELPDPGTLTTNKYIALFPAGVLLNESLMRSAGGDPRAAAPRICVVGLGSGSGIACFAHHFPKAVITVVDIDRVVVELVRDHYPLLRWLEQQGRLRLIVRDARQFIHSEGRKGTRWDLIVLDAYTSGSTIPPHLMTREFYAECGAALADGGIVMSNIIGSYEANNNGTGSKHLVLGGAIRSMVAGGLGHVHNIPILQHASPADFARADSRNNMVLAAKTAIGPREAAAGWERLRNFVIFPELRTSAQGEQRFTTSSLCLVKERSYDSASVAFAAIAAIAPELRANLKPFPSDFAQQSSSSDRTVVELAQRAVREAYAGKPLPLGWDLSADGRSLFLTQTDWVEHARKEWSAAIAFARDAAQHSAQALVGNGDDRSGALIPEAPLFTDGQPNADIYNGG